jgi:hypothetical protein
MVISMMVPCSGSVSPGAAGLGSPGDGPLGDALPIPGDADLDRYPPPQPIPGLGRRAVGAWAKSSVLELLANPSTPGRADARHRGVVDHRALVVETHRRPAVHVGPRPLRQPGVLRPGHRDGHLVAEEPDARARPRSSTPACNETSAAATRHRTHNPLSGLTRMVLLSSVPVRPSTSHIVPAQGAFLCYLNPS